MATAGLPGTPQIRESISKLFVPKVNHRFNKRPTSEAEYRQHDVLIVVIVIRQLKTNLKHQWTGVRENWHRNLRCIYNMCIYIYN